MRGWLIYDEQGAARNRWFIDECIRVGATHGLSIELKIVESSAWEIPTGELPDFALVRTIAPKLNEYLEGLGVRVFNRYAVSRVANDKWESYLFAKGLGLPVMPTELVAEYMNGSPFGYPAVVKSRDGHGGAEVFLARSESEWTELVSQLETERFIVQPLCDEVGKDLRVYVLGGEILAGVYRVSESDFRSNYSLGGSVQRIPAPMETVKMVQILHQSLGLDFVGADFIRHDGKWVFNELEDSVGCRMLYQTSNIDAVAEYIGYVAKMMRNNG